MTRLSITVDGVRYDDVAPRALPVTHLREALGKMGTVVGRDTSNCGACTILMPDPAGDPRTGPADGRDRPVGVRSCAVLAVQADGREITAIEGLAGPDGAPHPVQRSFHERHALQCGFCTPGHDHGLGRPARRQPGPHRHRDPRGPEGQPVPVHGLPQHWARRTRFRRGDARPRPRHRARVTARTAGRAAVAGVAGRAAGGTRPADDLSASAEYRTHLTTVLTERAGLTSLGGARPGEGGAHAA